MEWGSGFTFAALVFLSLLALSHGQNLKTTGGPDIPEHLLACYRNQSIYHRAFRLPSTIGSVIGLIRKLEASPMGRNYNARELSQILQFYVRMDGIKPSEYLSSTDGFNSIDDDTVLPFAASGDEFFRHRLSVIKLIRSSSSVTRTFFNESLSLQQLCNLHFMLSYSTDSRKRSDEQCTQQDEIFGAFSRGKRQAQNTDVTTDEEQASTSVENIDTTKNSLTIADIKPEIDQDVEQLPPDVVTIMENSKSSDEPVIAKTEDAIAKSEDFRIGNSELLSAGLVGGSRGNGRAYGSDRNSNRYGNNPRYDNPLRGGVAKYVPAIEKSDCPVENGVVYTKYGSVTLGTVIAGIAAGLNPQDINPTEFGIAPGDIRPDLISTRVNNVWASTIAGNIADMILNVGAIGINALDNAAGLKGWWNDTINYQWYLLQKDEPSYLTDVEVRGSIDGLILGQNVKKWPDMKLSQILSLYYSEVNSVDPTIQACKRKESFTRALQNDDFIRQVEIFCNVMGKQRPNTATITDYAQLANSAANNVQRYVDSLDGTMTCSNAQGEYTTGGPIDFSLTLGVVLDNNWPPSALINIMRILSDKEVVASSFTSNATFICGSNGEILFSASDPSGLASNFTLSNCPGGLNVNAALFGLDKVFRPLYGEEKLTAQTKRGAFAAMFLPYSPSSITNTSDVIQAIKQFNYSMPDVKFIAVTTGGKDSLGYLVNDVNSDVFVIRTPMPNDRQSQQDLAQVATKLKNIPQRLLNPRCGSYSEYEAGDGKLIDTVRVSYTKNYRIHPNYFYTISNVPRVTIRSVNGVPLNVCFSRVNAAPTGDPTTGTTPGDRSNPGYPGYPNPRDPPSSNNFYRGRTGGYNSPNYGNNYFGGRLVSADTKCLQVGSSAVNLELDSSPCSDYGSISSCPPIYISVNAPLGTTPPQNNICGKDYCRYPTDGEFEFTVSNLSCDNGAGIIKFQPVVLLFTLLFIAVLQRLH